MGPVFSLNWSILANIYQLQRKGGDLPALRCKIVRQIVLLAPWQHGEQAKQDDKNLSNGPIFCPKTNLPKYLKKQPKGEEERTKKGGETIPSHVLCIVYKQIFMALCG